MVPTNESQSSGFTWHTPVYPDEGMDSVPLTSGIQQDCNQYEYKEAGRETVLYGSYGENYGMAEYNNNTVMGAYDSKFSGVTTIKEKIMVCDPCGQKTTEEESAGHLLFGGVECTECRLQLRTCEDFRKRKEGRCSYTHDSNHIFQFCKDFGSFHEKTSPRKSGNQSPVLQKLSFHANKQESLRNTASWISTINNGTSCQDNVTEIYMDYTPVNQESGLGAVESSDKAERSILQDQEGEFGDVLLLESYSLDHVEEMVEYHVAKNDSTDCIILEEVKPQKCTQANRSLCLFELPDDLKTKRETKLETCPEDWKIGGGYHDSKKGIKLEVKPKQNTDIFDSPAKVKREPKQEFPIHPKFMETPSDGYYYLGHEAIEECPMCYAALCPSRFTVNARTYVLTTVCTDCNLPIYLMIDPYSLL